MNAPDITLFIQIIHFGVAYTILRTLVFSPILQILNKEKQQRDLLHQSIESATLDKEKAMKKKDDRWFNIKQALYNLVPVLSFKYFSSKQENNHISLKASLSEDDKKNFKNIAVQSLMDIKS